MPTAVVDAPQVSEARQAVDAWQIVVADQDSAAAQMAMDEALARAARATFRLFRWQRPAVSLGFKQRPPAWVEPGALARHGIEVVERPTGGGIAFHGSDLSCSVVVPQEPRRALASLMEGVCEALAQGVRELGVEEVEWAAGDAGAGRSPTASGTPIGDPAFGGVPASVAGPAAPRQPDHTAEWFSKERRMIYCLTQESPYALMVAQRKLCGLAIRRYQTSWLIQGSLLVGALPAAFAQVMPAEVSGAFQARAITLEEAAGRLVCEEDLLTAMIGAWRRTWSMSS